MKKIIFTAFMITVLISSINCVLALEDEYQIFMEYDGKIIVDEEKSATVTLKGTEAPVHTNVRIKVDLTGPATPKLLATDSVGNEYDIASIGYWGPESGFTVGGTFTNVTPIRATFPETGKYTVTLTLIDVNDPLVEYAKETFTLTVESNIVVDEGISEDLTDGDEELGEITELPQTGNYNFIYFVSIIGIMAVIAIFYIFRLKKSNN